MTDGELIANLRTSKGWPNLGNAAADRIEQLVKDNMLLTANKNAAHKLRNDYFLRAKLAEAKLAKAMEALREIKSVECEYCTDYFHQLANEVLAELEKTE